MDPINVDFGGNKERAKSVEPKGSTLKRVIISLLITIVLGAAAYYLMLPALWNVLLGPTDDSFSFFSA